MTVIEYPPTTPAPATTTEPACSFIAKSSLREDFREVLPLHEAVELKAIEDGTGTVSLFALTPEDLYCIQEQSSDGAWSSEALHLGKDVVHFDVALNAQGKVMIAAQMKDRRQMFIVESSFGSWQWLNAAIPGFAPASSGDSQFWFDEAPDSDEIVLYTHFYNNDGWGAEVFGYWRNLGAAPLFTELYRTQGEYVGSTVWTTGRYKGNKVAFYNVYRTVNGNASSYLGYLDLTTPKDGFQRMLERGGFSRIKPLSGGHEPNDTCPLLLSRFINGGMDDLYVYRSREKAELVQLTHTQAPKGAYSYFLDRHSLNYRGKNGTGLEIFTYSSALEALVHITEDSDTGGWREPAPILKMSAPTRATAPFTVCAGKDGIHHVFARSADGDFKHLWQNELGEWHERAMVAHSGKLHKVQAFVTELTLVDEHELPVMNAEVLISASQSTDVIINHRPLCIDERGVRCSTDFLGRLLISDEAEGLSTPSLRIHYPASTEGSCHVLEASRPLEQRLQYLKPDELRKATVPNPGGRGESALLDDNAKKSADATAKAINTVMSLTARKRNVAATRFGVHRLSDDVMSHLAASEALPHEDNLIHQDAVPEQYWRICFPANVSEELVFEELTRTEAGMHAERLLESDPRQPVLRQRALMGEQWTWGDLWAAIRAGDFARVVEIVARTVGEGIQMTIKVIIDGVERIWQGIIKFIEQAADVVRQIFHTLGVAFDKLCRWLGFVFNWDDIVIARDVMKTMIEQSLDAMSITSAKMKSVIEAAITKFEGRSLAFIDSGFDALVESLRAKEPFSTYSKGNEQISDEHRSAIKDGASKNVLLQHLEAYHSTSDNAGYLAEHYRRQPLVNSNMSAAFADSLTDAFGEALDALSRMVSSAVFNKLKDNLELMVKDIREEGQNVFSRLLIGIVELIRDLAKGSVKLLSEIAKALINAIANAVAGLKQQLASPMQIPLLSDIYRYLTGNELITCSYIEFAALLVAVPTVITYKIISGEVLFTKESAAAFRARIKTLFLDRAVEFDPARDLGFAPTSAKKLGQYQYEAFMAPTWTRIVSAVIATACATIATVTSIITDVANDWSSLEPHISWEVFLRTQPIILVQLICDLIAPVFQIIANAYTPFYALDWLNMATFWSTAGLDLSGIAYTKWAHRKDDDALQVVGWTPIASYLFCSATWCAIAIGYCFESPASDLPTGFAYALFVSRPWPPVVGRILLKKLADKRKEYRHIFTTVEIIGDVYINGAFIAGTWLLAAPTDTDNQPNWPVRLSHREIALKETEFKTIDISEKSYSGKFTVGRLDKSSDDVSFASSTLTAASFTVHAKSKTGIDRYLVCDESKNCSYLKVTVSANDIRVQPESLTLRVGETRIVNVSKSSYAGEFSIDIGYSGLISASSTSTRSSFSVTALKKGAVVIRIFTTENSVVTAERWISVSIEA